MQECGCSEIGSTALIACFALPVGTPAPTCTYLGAKNTLAARSSRCGQGGHDGGGGGVFVVEKNGQMVESSTCFESCMFLRSSLSCNIRETDLNNQRCERENIFLL